MNYPIFDGTLESCEFCGENSCGHNKNCPSLITNKDEREKAEKEWQEGFEIGFENEFLPTNVSVYVWIGFGRGLSKRVIAKGDESLWSCEDVKGL